MADSALRGVFREYRCQHAGGTLTINFEAYDFPQLVFQPGADPKVVRGLGSCVSPAVMPETVGPGSELSMTWRGVPGILRITQVSVDPLEVLDQVLGTEFIGEWQPS